MCTGLKGSPVCKVVVCGAKKDGFEQSCFCIFLLFLLFVQVLDNHFFNKIIKISIFANL